MQVGETEWEIFAQNLQMDPNAVTTTQSSEISGQSCTARKVRLLAPRPTNLVLVVLATILFTIFVVIFVIQYNSK